VLRGVFVTGTDTNVGKTVVSAAILTRYRQVAPLRYWKPIQTGIEHDDDTSEVGRLTGCDPRELFDCGVRLVRPLSPHLAAELSHQTIELQPLVHLAAAETAFSRWIVEGAGGALVPINGAELMTDFMQRLSLPIVIAARSALGTINHTLLTIEALRRRSLTIAGIVLVGSPNTDNRRAIERYGSVPVLGEMPKFDPLTPAAVLEWATSELDAEGRLEEALR
jgi:dethiobiotin synthase